MRDSSPTIADAFERIEAIRAATLVQLRDSGLRDLATPQGLKPAREKLAEALRIALPGDTVVAQLRERIDLATHYGSFRPGQVFSDALRDGGRGPQMVVVPHGGFQMGAGDTEPGATDAECPAHYVRFERGFAMAITEVTVADFERFVKATNTRPRATRRGHSVVYDERSGNFIRRSGVDWRSDYDGARAMGNQPVMHVSVRDAENYANWLSEQTGRSYRLPSEAEFEYALRAGSSGRYPWGDAGTPPEGAGNFTGGRDVSPSGRHWHNAFIGYGDGWWGAGTGGHVRPQCLGPARHGRQPERVGVRLLACQLPAGAVRRRVLVQPGLPRAGDPWRELGQRAGAEPRRVAAVAGFGYHLGPHRFPPGARHLNRHRSFTRPPPRAF